ncbi:MAG: DM13 domain-containing protein [Thaumarchaeota archaeon]|nr:DM13 domain-containing protein [Nitrososphaerota archaeon]
MLKTITISIMIGTFLMGTYYVLAASYLPPVQENKLVSALNKMQTDLTYEKFISMGENERMTLVQQMPSNTIQMLLEEAQNHPSYISEDTDKIKLESNSNDIRFTKLTQITGVKGYDGSGTASVVYAGNMAFLRLEDFSVTSGIDQHLYLTKDGTIASGIDLGPLKASVGDQNYDITGINTDAYNIMMIYSKTFDTYYAYTKFLKTE